VSTGTTTSAMRRNDLIAAALRKISEWPNEGQVSFDRYDQAVKALNAIIRAESLYLNKQHAALWAQFTGYTVMVANAAEYNVASGLAANIEDMTSISFRAASATSGIEAGGAWNRPMNLLNRDQFFAISEPGQVAIPDRSGFPMFAFLDKQENLANNNLFVWPIPQTVAVASQVLGTDGNNYTCILGHTSDPTSQPITGQSFSYFWTLAGSAGVAWVTGTGYSNQETLVYVAKRPLFDFNNPWDNPDMPLGWEQFLIYKLALELAPEYNKPLAERVWLERKVNDERIKLFPGATASLTGDGYHNRALFF